MIPAFGARKDAPASSDSGDFTFMALFKRSLTKGTIVNIASNTVTRPGNTTTYAAGELVIGSPAVAFSWDVGVSAFRLHRLRLKKSQATIAAANFIMHLYGATPTPGVADNAAFISNQAASYLGSMRSLELAFDLTADGRVPFSDGAVQMLRWETQDGSGGGSPLEAPYIKLASGTTLFGLLETGDAYAPLSAETFIATGEFERLT